MSAKSLKHVVLLRLEFGASRFRETLSALIFVGEAIARYASSNARNSIRDYARTTAIRWRNSSSISPGTATVWAISSRNRA